MDKLEAEILPKFQSIVAQSLRIDANQVTIDSSLDALGAESLDMVEITTECESAFNVWIPEETLLDTAERVFGIGSVIKEGHLTELGREIFAARIRPEEIGLLEGDVPVEAIQRHFMRVGSWVTMLAILVKQTPVTCAECEGSLKASLGFRLRCVTCGKEVTLRSGEAINREWLQSFRDSRELKAAASGLPQTA